MKVFTAILMLCLPMAAMGETYICTEEKSSYLSSVGVTAEDKSDGKVTVIDTEKGVRDLELEKGLGFELPSLGTCQKSEDEIICTNIVTSTTSTGKSFDRTLITLKDMIYTRIFQVTSGGSNRTWAEYGTCTKL